METKEQEVEVIPVMIQVGAFEAMGFNPEFDSTWDLVRNVYRVMFRASL